MFLALSETSAVPVTSHRRYWLICRSAGDTRSGWRGGPNRSGARSARAATRGPADRGLHDIGYAAALRDTGFHPLAGTRHLTAAGWPARIAGLVAHHSGARFVAEARGLAEYLADFPFEQSPVSDALIYADQTVVPNGVSMNLEQRLADMIERHGSDSPNATAHVRRAPVLRAAVQQVDQRLVVAQHPSSAA